MERAHIARAEISLSASPDRVWKTLTDPAEVKQFLFGVELKTDWKVGSPILFQGEWNGQAFEDKGTVLEFEEGRKILYSYWSSFSGLADHLENYQNVCYNLAPLSHGTSLSVSQENLPSEEQRGSIQENWQKVLEKIKSLIES